MSIRPRHRTHQCSRRFERKSGCTRPQSRGQLQPRPARRGPGVATLNPAGELADRGAGPSSSAHPVPDAYDATYRPGKRRPCIGARAPVRSCIKTVVSNRLTAVAYEGEMFDEALIARPLEPVMSSSHVRAPWRSSWGTLHPPMKTSRCPLPARHAIAAMLHEGRGSLIAGRSAR